MGAYSRAIARVVKPGDTVIDLGAGTGILSFMAVRAGAARVYAIEKEPIINLASYLAKVNGIADRIIFIHKNSRDVSIADIRKRADVLISETIGAFGIQEHIVEYFEDAARRLMKPNARFIPRRLRLFVAPVSWPAQARAHVRLTRVAGFDFRPAACVYANSVDWTNTREGYTFLARKALIADFLLGKEAVHISQACGDSHRREIATKRASGGQGGRFVPPEGAFARFRIKEGRRLDGYLGWFEAELADGVVLSSKHTTHWPNLFLPLSIRRDVPAGSHVEFTLWISKRLSYSWRTVIRRGDRILLDTCQSTALADELASQSLKTAKKKQPSRP